MEVLTLIAPGDVNQSLLREEIATAGLPLMGFGMRGFTTVKIEPFVDLFARFAAPKVIVTKTGEPDVVADPGEFNFKTQVALTPTEEMTLAAVLTAHDSTQRTVEQQRAVQHRNSAATLKNIYQQWDSLTPAQKDSGTREAIRRLARVIDKLAGST
jgi:hypothetical protein